MTTTAFAYLRCRDSAPPIKIVLMVDGSENSGKERRLSKLRMMASRLMPHMKDLSADRFRFFNKNWRTLWSWNFKHRGIWGQSLTSCSGPKRPQPELNLCALLYCRLWLCALLYCHLWLCALLYLLCAFAMFGAVNTQGFVWKFFMRYI